jgi:hypothetical protein
VPPIKPSKGRGSAGRDPATFFAPCTEAIFEVYKINVNRTDTTRPLPGVLDAR